MSRLLNAYRALWDWCCGVIYFALLAMVIVSATGGLVGAIAISPRSPLTLISAGVLFAAALLLRFAPDGDDDERGGDQ